MRISSYEVQQSSLCHTDIMWEQTFPQNCILAVLEQGGARSHGSRSWLRDSPVTVAPVLRSGLRDPSGAYWKWQHMGRIFPACSRFSSALISSFSLPFLKLHCLPASMLFLLVASAHSVHRWKAHVVSNTCLSWNNTFQCLSSVVESALTVSTLATRLFELSWLFCR